MSNNDITMHFDPTGECPNCKAKGIHFDSEWSYMWCIYCGFWEGKGIIAKEESK